ncbi:MULTISPECIES: type 1 glutamine amidotransferase domain-containing protein [Nocardiopsidaceae]|jgi:protease I|uniref:Type 1 glutamine amidotransferase n=2 Tax=Nocardiopsidaceae TaxID=83676 RepID=A0ABY6YVH2_9ACTN|nr:MULTISPECIES: type 1 glutamine amidotransferase domain-containing protein [Nocardiopsaceae]MEE2052736.1 type 1 glutamine amidotransferase domain-containing protein [Nocardiopsis umidischolae]WAE76382.1 type 1 glutamine amidotransferase [Streptomonospora nanhaiensis]
MADRLNGRRIAILAADGVERVELVRPREALREEGASTDLVSLSEGEIQSMNGDIEPSERFAVDRVVSEAKVEDYDALVVPGGTVNPDNLRLDADAVGFVRDFVAAGKPVAAICHGPWILVEADVVRGRTVTSYPSIRTDIRNAGGVVVDEEVVTDHGVTTSRNPDDLPAFCERIVREFAQG